MKYTKVSRFMVSIILCLSAGAFGSIFTATSVETWYQSLNKPSFNPPSWLFAPVWTALYLMMGVSLFLVWSSQNTPGGKKNASIILFLIQLILNALWSVLFFGLQNPLLAFIEIVLLWLAIIATISFFRKISAFSAFLLVPYLLWVTFAAILNLSIFILN
jgi:translocator protein